MSSLTRFLKSGQLIQLLGNPAVANPPTKIRPPVADYPTLESWIKFTNNQKPTKSPDNFSSNSPTVININKPKNVTTTTDERQKVKKMVARKDEIVDAGGFDTPIPLTHPTPS